METTKSLCNLAKEAYEKALAHFSLLPHEKRIYIASLIYAAYRDALIDGYWLGMQDAKEIMCTHKKKCMEDFDYWYKHHCTVKRKQD